MHRNGVCSVGRVCNSQFHQPLHSYSNISFGPCTYYMFTNIYIQHKLRKINDHVECNGGERAYLTLFSLPFFNYKLYSIFYSSVCTPSDRSPYHHVSDCSTVHWNWKFFTETEISYPAEQKMFAFNL